MSEPSVEALQSSDELDAYFEQGKGLDEKCANALKRYYEWHGSKFKEIFGPLAEDSIPKSIYTMVYEAIRPDGQKVQINLTDRASITEVDDNGQQLWARPSVMIIPEYSNWIEYYSDGVPPESLSGEDLRRHGGGIQFSRIGASPYVWEEGEFQISESGTRSFGKNKGAQNPIDALGTLVDLLSSPGAKLVYPVVAATSTA